MEAVFMSAGILTAIILCVVGLAKLPFNKFKEKHPKGYKAVFTGLSIILTFGACLINQAFVLAQPLFNLEFWVMLATTFAGVFGLYHTYEGLGAKELVKKLTSSISSLVKSATPDSKVSKLVKKYGLDKVEASIIAEKTKQEEAKVAEAQAETAVAEPIVEQTTNNPTVNQ